MSSHKFKATLVLKDVNRSTW